MISFCQHIPATSNFKIYEAISVPFVKARQWQMLDGSPLGRRIDGDRFEGKRRRSNVIVQFSSKLTW